MLDPIDPDRRLSVLIVHNRYRLAGGEDEVVEAETALLRERGHRVEQVIVDNRNLADPAGPADLLRLARDTVWSRSAATRVADATEVFGADIVHIHNFLPQLSPAIHGAARTAGSAVVQTLHNYRLICPAATLLRDGRPCQDCRGLPVALPAVVHACYRGSRAQTTAVAAMLAVHRVRRTWTRDVDAFIALTQFAAERIGAGGLPKARIAIKPNFVAARAAQLHAEPREGFLFAGRLSEEKGVRVLLDAWKTLDLPTTLRIAGEGPLADLVRDVSARDPRVTMLGFLSAPAVESEMQRARTLVAPSIWFEGGVPLTIIEAFAASLPVIAAGHGSMLDIIRDETNGLLVTPGDATALARAMRRTVHDEELAGNLRRGALAAYQATYTPEANYELLMAIYRQAIQHRHAGQRGPARA